MKKVYLSFLSSNGKLTAEGYFAKDYIEKMVKEQGCEVTTNYNEADVYLKQVEKEFAYENAVSEKIAFFYYDYEVKDFVFLRKTAKQIKPRNIKGRKEIKKIEFKATELELKDQVKSIVFYMLGKVDSIKIDKVLHSEILMELVRIYQVCNSNLAKAVTEKEIKAKSLGITVTELENVATMVKEVNNYKENQLVELLRKIDSFYWHLGQVIIPNMSDNIFTNMLDCLVKLLYANNSKDPDVQNKLLAKYHKNLANIKTTVYESITGSKSFQKYAKREERQMGVYSLYICNNSLADDEIKIPHPSNVGCSRKGYPQKGDYVINTRHPITTLVGRFKVVGYTDDCTIQVNSFVALCLFGDADGDSQTVSWSPWSDTLKFDNIGEFRAFAKALGLKLDDGEEFKVTKELVDKFRNSKLPDAETCLEKLSATGIEQGEAKLVTSQITGAFGSVERDVIQTLIVNNKKLTSDMLLNKAWLSQIPVQAKNLLSDLRSGKELDELTKETLKLFVVMSKTQHIAAGTIAKLLGITKNQAVVLIDSFNGIEAEILEKDKVENSTKEEIKSELLKEAQKF